MSLLEQYRLRETTPAEQLMKSDVIGFGSVDAAACGVMYTWHDFIEWFSYLCVYTSRVMRPASNSYTYLFSFLILSIWSPSGREGRGLRLNWGKSSLFVAGAEKGTLPPPQSHPVLLTMLQIHPLSTWSLLPMTQFLQS